MKKGMLTVIFITIIMALIIFGYGYAIMFGLLSAESPIIFIIIAVMVFVAIMGALIYNLIERIKEIEEEDKDDLSKY
ncbi:hypothetical protein SH2C18_16600 [Clostridium sediminicola]|uniref:hypothetical protein n=1 Tax=Clostridium sediminicola TaxID=3114879 RepID=UPI0031F26FE7